MICQEIVSWLGVSTEWKWKNPWGKQEKAQRVVEEYMAGLYKLSVPYTMETPQLKFNSHHLTGLSGLKVPWQAIRSNSEETAWVLLYNPAKALLLGQVKYSGLFRTKAFRLNDQESIVKHKSHRSKANVCAGSGAIYFLQLQMQRTTKSSITSVRSCLFSICSFLRYHRL